MKFKKLIAITLATVTVFSLAACGTNQKEEPANNQQAELSEDKTEESIIGIFITYGDDGSYGFVDKNTNTVFTAELPLDQIKDNNGNPLHLEDLKDGDELEFHGNIIMTASIPPIYAGITEVVRLEEGTKEVADKYRPMVEEELLIVADPSTIPTCSIETSQSYGDVSTAIYETSYDWNYVTEDGKEQHQVANEVADAELSILDMEGERVEGTITFFPNPVEVTLLLHTADGTEEVALKADKAAYTATLEAGKTYEIQAKWEHGFVNYKFETVTK